MIVAVNNLIEQRAVIKAWCLKKGIDPATIPTSMKCQFVIETPGGLIQTNDLKDAWKYAEELNENCITFDTFVHDILIPTHAEVINTLAKYKTDAKKYQEYINKIQSIFALP